MSPSRHRNNLEHFNKTPLHDQLKVPHTDCGRSSRSYNTTNAATTTEQTVEMTWNRFYVHIIPNMVGAPDVIASIRSQVIPTRIDSQPIVFVHPLTPTSECRRLARLVYWIGDLAYVIPMTQHRSAVFKDESEAGRFIPLTALVGIMNPSLLYWRLDDTLVEVLVPDIFGSEGSNDEEEGHHT